MSVNEGAVVPRVLHICVPEAAAFLEHDRIIWTIVMFEWCSFKKPWYQETNLIFEALISYPVSKPGKVGNLRLCRSAHVHFLKCGSLPSPVRISPDTRLVIFVLRLFSFI